MGLGFALGVEFLVLVFFNRRVGEFRAWAFQTDLGHGIAEQFAVFSLVDGFGLGADQLDVEFFKDAHLVERQRSIERRLPAHGGEDGIWAFFFNDLGHHFRRDGFDVSCIRQVRIGHDGGRIGIDEDDAITFFFQRLAGLCSGIVKFAGLADHNRPRPDDEDGFDICTFWHVGSRFGVS